MALFETGLSAVGSFGVQSGVCWSPELGVFVGVGFEIGALTSAVSTSPDGVVWTGHGNPFFDGVNNIHGSIGNGVCWSPELGIFVAVGSGPNQICWSPDGVTWTGLGSFWGPGGSSSTAATAGQGVCWSPDLGLFVAVGRTESSVPSIWTSPDGVTWTGRSNPMDAGGFAGVFGVAWSPAQARFVAVGQSGDTAVQVVTSPDGVTWTGHGAPFKVVSLDRGNAVAWSPDLSLWVAATTTADRGAVWSSPDGTTWTFRAGLWTGSGNGGAWSVAWSHELGLFCAVGSNFGTLTALAAVTSPDGITWTIYGKPWSAGHLGCVCASPALKHFCLLGNDESGASDVYRSAVFPLAPASPALNAFFSI